jgi:L-malate glycosyltransferase
MHAMRGVSILVSTNLGSNLTGGKLRPLVDVPDVREIVVVQDAAGPPLPKVRYVTLGASPLGRLAHALRRVVVLIAEIVRTRPTVVMGIYMMPHGLLAYLLGRLTRRQVCIHVIGGPGEIIDGGFWIDQWPVRRPSARIERLYLRVLQHADAVMVVGTETRKYLASRGVDDDRIHVMSSKIDAHRFRPVTDAPRDYDVILTARLIARKRVDLFLQLVADLRQRHPHVRAAILGDGPLQDDLEALARSLGVDACVDFLGFREDTERYYVRAKVFVLTSAAEGLSLAMLEAMACGVPAVVPAVGDLADVVSNGVTGYLIADHHREAFVTAISGLLADDALRRRLGDHARATILRGYTVEDGARAWRALLAREAA